MNEKEPSKDLVEPTSFNDSKATRVVKLLSRLTADQVDKYRRGQVLMFPFLVTDEDVRTFDSEITRNFDDLKINAQTDFIGEVRYSDLSTQRFSSFDEFIEKAGKRRDPERISVKWSKFEIEKYGEPMSGEVEIIFSTEQRLDTERADPDVIHRATVELSVSGSEQRWVDQLFEDLLPSLRTTAHGGYLKPLWVFRNPYVVQVLGLLFGYMSMIWAKNLLANKRTVDSKGEKTEKALSFIKDITSAPSIEEKFDIYVTRLYTPSTSFNNSTSEEIWSFVVLVTAFLSMYIAARYLLPKLTPNSSIAIGVAKRRAQVTLDTFKFLVFSILVAGFVIPAIRGIFNFFL